MDKLNGCIFSIKDADYKITKHNTIWVKVSTDIKKEFYSEAVYNENYLKIKIKSHGEECSDFYNNKFLS